MDNSSLGKTPLNNMRRTTIEPRFCETDAFGHIGNTVLPIWFEHARRPIFQKISKEFSREKWPTIIAHMNFNFINQIFIEHPVYIDVGISKIGTKSLTVYHEAWQNDVKVTTGECVIVWFDHIQQRSIEIPEDMRASLQELLIVEPEA